MFFARNADAGVAHGKAQVHLAVRRGFSRGALDLHNHFAPFGELDRIPHKVQKHLAQPAGVPDQGVGHIRLYVAYEFQSLAVGSHRQRAQRVPHRRPQREISRVQHEFAGLDLREV